tara:strand:+ start:152 stop:733 length:582 start_codon:yes stop_codon:yes gene_type:complete
MNKRSEPYCEMAYSAIRANMHNWGDPKWYRPLTRSFYDNVFHSSNNNTGFITKGSVEARIAYKLNPKFYKNGKKKEYQPCYDHYLSPQFVAVMVISNPDIYLDCIESFAKIFELSTSVVETTNPENTAMRGFTTTKKGVHRIKVPSDEKYDRAGITLCKRPKGVTELAKAVITEEKLFYPKELLEFEKRFLVV